ncbi:MAG: Asp-tRNA(Asn)/Glu-tRNA(Gln) amidotransferase subunit GatC [Legionellaceae bacterium]|nr:Asp-tRNA(Asn)/Glu-tRNA(Gln) amidotransferase subunit GatC [Legionellaceae bacterium]
MTLHDEDLQQIGKLAHLEVDPLHHHHLLDEINTIIDFVEQLRQANTAAVAPLFHPFDLHQRLREDEVCEQSCLNELADIAPLFAEGHYLVPKVIDDA